MTVSSQKAEAAELDLRALRALTPKLSSGGITLRH
jgi:hypothetical protein